MRTLIISDIHIDINENYDVIGELASYAKSEKTEYIIIAGDISENVELTLPAITSLEEKSGAIVLYVPGNHDMWEPNRENDKLYERY
ncbi:MAG: metallophosphoesterase family protein, partial [Lachnospiraceae bacterium]|nr:metallophosphoesterase family protein [Lachnospiraceae bacterium]